MNISPHNRGNQHGKAFKFTKLKAKVDALNHNPAKFFTVKTVNDRVLVRRYIKTLSDDGKLNAQISTREVITKRGKHTNTYRVFSVPN